MDGYINLNDLSQEIHDWARDKGFWDRERIALADEPDEPRYAPSRSVRNPSIAGEKLALMHSEISEALESERDGDTNTEEEMADLIIRALDFCGWRGYNIQRAVLAKIEKNRHRPRLHGRSF